MIPLRRQEMSVGLAVGLWEGGDGQRLHGVIESLDRYGAHVWIHDTAYSTALPRSLRGFVTRLSYEQAEGGAMWAEPATPLPPSPTGATGTDLLAYLTDEARCGRDRSALAHRTAARRVLAAQPDGEATDITTASAAVLARFADANRTALSESTLAQYASNYRSARRKYLRYLSAPDRPVRLAIGLGAGRSITVTTPGPLSNADRDHALRILGEHWTRSCESEGDTAPAHPDEQPGAMP
jgi:hypothetical protein